MLKVSFAEVDAEFLRSKVEQGYYSSISEAIRDAVRKIREMEEGRLMYALEAAEQDVQDGRIEPLDHKLFDDLVETGIKAAKNGKKIIRPDVHP